MLAGMTYIFVIQQVSHRASETFTPEDCGLNSEIAPQNQQPCSSTPLGA